MPTRPSNSSSSAFGREKEYRQLFDARLMKKRWELGLPLVAQPAFADLPKEVQQSYQDGYVQAATEVGELYLADGDIPRAWTYFRALGNTKPVAEALDTFVRQIQIHPKRRICWARPFRSPFRKA